LGIFLDPLLNGFTTEAFTMATGFYVVAGTALLGAALALGPQIKKKAAEA